jgi:hypothetical protein
MSASAIVFTAVRRAQELYHRAISEVLSAAEEALQARTLSWGQETVIAREYRCACGLCTS